MVDFGCDRIAMVVVGVVAMAMVGLDYDHVVVMVETSCDSRGWGWL